MPRKLATPHRPLSIQISPQDHQMIELLGEAYGSPLSKQEAMRYAIDLFHVHMRRARLDFPGL